MINVLQSVFVGAVALALWITQGHPIYLFLTGLSSGTTLFMCVYLVMAWLEARAS